MHGDEGKKAATEAEAAGAEEAEKAAASEAPAQTVQTETEDFLKYITDIDLEKYDSDYRAAKEAKCEPRWHQLLDADNKRLRRKILGDEGSLSDVHLKLRSFFDFLPGAFGFAAAGAVYVLMGAVPQQVVADLEADILELTVCVLLAVVFWAVLAGYCIKAPGIPGRLFLVATPACLMGGAFGLLAGFCARALVPETAVASGAVAVVLFAAFAAMFSLLRGAHFFNQREHLHRLRTRIRNEMIETARWIEKYQERAINRNPDTAPMGVLKQRLMSRRHWDFHYSIELMYRFFRYDVDDLGLQEGWKTLRRWGWMGAFFLLGVTAQSGSALTLLEADGMRAATGAWAALLSAWGLALLVVDRYCRKKIDEAAAATQYRATEDSERLLGLLSAEKLDWQARWEFDDLRKFVLEYKDLLEEMRAMALIQGKRPKAGSPEIAVKSDPAPQALI